MKNKKAQLFEIFFLILIISALICSVFVLFPKPVYKIKYEDITSEDFDSEYWYNNGSGISFEPNNYDKVPDNYTLVQVYEEVCSEDMYCKYFKRNFYIEKEKKE